MASPASTFAPYPSTLALAPPHAPALTPPLASARAQEASSRADLPPSARTVFAFLQLGPKTHKEIVSDAGLPARTARFAVDRLRREGLVEEVPSLRDARQSYYRARRDGN